MPCCHSLSLHLPEKQLGECDRSAGLGQAQSVTTNERNCSRVATATKVLPKKDEISSDDRRMLYPKCTKMHSLALISSHCNWLFLSSRLSLLPQYSSCKNFQIASKSATRLVFAKVPGGGDLSLRWHFLSLKQWLELFFWSTFCLPTAFLSCEDQHRAWISSVDTCLQLILFRLSLLFVFNPLP